MTMNANRTLEMKSAYVPLFRTGMTPKQIAKEFDLSEWTVYHYLDEIAQENGVPRESLLIGKGHRANEALNNRGVVQSKEEYVNLGTFWESYDNVRNGLDELIKELVGQMIMF